MRRAFLFSLFCLALALTAHAELLTATISTPPPAQTGYFKLGTGKNPEGREISVNSRSLLLDGQPWLPAMGELHYARVPQKEWREELLKMKLGGVDIVSTYVFWIHHEEIEGQWDWTGSRDLHQFLETCREVGLKVVVRCGPWSHGEVRNGGFPDWVIAHKDWRLRSMDTNFLAAVKILYAQIGDQLRGELWKDGGPVIGVQLDNEYGGSPDYLLTLKQMAIASGIDVPFYAKTGWPEMRRPVPLGELLPFFGCYAEGFWEDSPQPMPDYSWENFIFKSMRTDAGIGDDELGHRRIGDTVGTEKYPYLCCEIGGGMETSYHRRMNDDPRDIEAVALCQLGSGSSMMGYYMYHGGQNPEGKLTTLQESQASGYANDLPVKNYDFNAPIGEYGQLNPQYYWLRRLHLFLHDFGGALAPMPLTLPDQVPTKMTDLATLRWSVRSDGHSGYVFVNNYQRAQPMPPKPGVQFDLKLPGGDLVFPQAPVTIPADDFFFWPFNLDLGGAKLIYATAQPICRTEVNGTQTFYFAETPGVKAEFVFDPKTIASSQAVFNEVISDGIVTGFDVQPQAGKRIHVELWSDRVSLDLRQSSDGKWMLGDEWNTRSKPVQTELLQPAGPPRQIPLSAKNHLPLAPTDADFTNAAIWKITLPANLNLNYQQLLRIHYVGDVARVTLNGKLLDDNFYNGRYFDISLKRYAPEIARGGLRLEILSLRRNAPIYFEPKDRPDFGANEDIVKLQSAEIVTCDWVKNFGDFGD